MIRLPFTKPLYVAGFKKHVGSYNDGGHLIWGHTLAGVLQRSMELVGSDHNMVPLFLRYVKPVRPPQILIDTYLARERKLDEDSFLNRVFTMLARAQAVQLPKGIKRCSNVAIHANDGSWPSSCRLSSCREGFRATKQALKRLVAAGEKSGLFNYKAPEIHPWPAGLPVAFWPPDSLFYVSYDGWDHGRGATMTRLDGSWAPDINDILGMMQQIGPELDFSSVISYQEEMQKKYLLAQEEEAKKRKKASEARVSRADVEAKRFVAKLMEAMGEQKDKHWLIIGSRTKEPIGCCSNRQDVLAEEPEATFTEIAREKCPICKG